MKLILPQKDDIWKDKYNRLWDLLDVLCTDVPEHLFSKVYSRPGHVVWKKDFYLDIINYRLIRIIKNI